MNTKENDEYYEKTIKTEEKLFENINNKIELFDLFVIVSYEVFKKPYYATTFLSFLINNEDLIKQNFGENTNYIRKN